jgi:predicted site-specific integrase-resolvase
LRNDIPIRERYGVTAVAAAQFIGISRTRIYELLKDGTLEGKVVRGRRIVLVNSLLRMVGEAPPTAAKTAA